MDTSQATDVWLGDRNSSGGRANSDDSM